MDDLKDGFPDLPLNLVTSEPAGAGPPQGLPPVAPTNSLSLPPEAVQADQTEEADRLRKLLKAKVADLGLTELDLLAYAKSDAQ